MNMGLFRVINNLAHNKNSMNEVMIFISKYSPYIFMIIVVSIFIKGIINKNSNYRVTAVNTLTFAAINIIINSIIGGMFYVNRPFVHNDVNLLYPHSANSSFHSNHASGTMSVAKGMYTYKRCLSMVLIISSLLVGFSRIYVGHHYPADIIGAYVIVFITNRVYNKKLRKRLLPYIN